VHARGEGGSRGVLCNSTILEDPGQEKKGAGPGLASKKREVVPINPEVGRVSIKGLGAGEGEGGPTLTRHETEKRSMRVQKGERSVFLGKGASSCKEKESVSRKGGKRSAPHSSH